MAQRDDATINWVPTGHPFPKVLGHYLSFRKQATGRTTASDFQDWLIGGQLINKASTAQAYCFPLRTTEFDLTARTVPSLEIIAHGGWEGLLEATGGQDCFLPGLAGEHVCLVDVWLVGYLTECARQAGQRPQELLVLLGFAGTESSASTLLYVGRSVGQHFGLLDTDDLPTASFEVFYRYLRRSLALGR
ncbi:hypothetical protein [Pseudomonas sp. D(2018)]|uniref:hypothetical protein n=1 Tax=Pseudomonas sp. D(2018) TaxID=2502238 RepID=UPI0010F6C18B|nr:hypothetical protein [Pseudomonas sp. D(2018)]